MHSKIVDMTTNGSAMFLEARSASIDALRKLQGDLVKSVLGAAKVIFSQSADRVAKALKNISGAGKGGAGLQFEVALAMFHVVTAEDLEFVSRLAPPSALSLYVEQVEETMAAVRKLQENKSWACRLLTEDVGIEFLASSAGLDFMSSLDYLKEECADATEFVALCGRLVDKFVELGKAAILRSTNAMHGFQAFASDLGALAIDKNSKTFGDLLKVVAQVPSKSAKNSQDMDDECVAPRRPVDPSLLALADLMLPHLGHSSLEVKPTLAGAEVPWFVLFVAPRLFVGAYYLQQMLVFDPARPAGDIAPMLADIEEVDPHRASLNTHKEMLPLGVPGAEMWIDAHLSTHIARLIASTPPLPMMFVGRRAV